MLLRFAPLMLAVVCVFGGAKICAADDTAPYTPKPGSAVRTAICDAVRKARGKSKTKYIINYLRVHGDWALFDGSPDPVEEGDTAATLRRVDGKWTVAHNWQHGDVPSPEEFAGSKAARAVSPVLLQEYKKAKGF